MATIGDSLRLLAARAAPSVDSRQSNEVPEGLTPGVFGQVGSARTGLILAVNIACITLISTFVITRLLVRRLMTRQFFLDDTLALTASVFTIGLCTVTLLAVRVGLGRHVWNLNLDTILEDVKKCVQLMFVANILYVCAITSTKLSIIVSYLRIFPYNTLRVAMYITAAVTVGLFLASVPATIFQCKPISAAWDLGIGDPGAKCFSFVNFLYASTAINVTTDLVLCTAPLPYFWNLQLPRKQKIIVSFLFFIGGFACVASIVRLTYLHLLNGIDVTWNLAPSVLWTIAECTIGICCVSVPAMRPLFGRLLPDVFLTRLAATDPAGGAYHGTDARRRAYAMGRWSGGETKSPVPSHPEDGEEEEVEEEGEERPTSQTDLMTVSVADDDEEQQKQQQQRPATWSVADGGAAPERLQAVYTVATVEAGGKTELPERVPRKG